MEKKEHIEFVFTFEYDPIKKEDFGTIWNLGFKMLKLVDDYREEFNNNVKTVINESPGAIVDRELLSV